jgi:hypothetical protein
MTPSMGPKVAKASPSSKKGTFSLASSRESRSTGTPRAFCVLKASSWASARASGTRKR